MNIILECWFFWHTMFFENNRVLRAYKISRTRSDYLLSSNALWCILIFYIFGASNYNLVVVIAIGVSLIQLLVAIKFNREVKVFLKSKFSDNYHRAWFQTWLENKADREKFLEELYLFERAAYDKWAAEGGLERECEEKEEQRRKRKEAFEEIKTEFKNAWYEEWEKIKTYTPKEEMDEFEQSYHNNEHETEGKQHSPFSADERVNDPIKWALKIMDLPTNTVDFKMIRSKYRELMKVHHPDIGGDETKCKQLIDAYSILTEAYGKKVS